ncbi:2'-5' RNA ligase family protein [Prosthecomicrobium sp. N25]|uniref:2'-5' RNA ligase family protein n=1 Tax=Prosthecomicrobium sp. N25 TaxID=3129254 RepID=UPI0030782D6F
MTRPDPAARHSLWLLASERDERALIQMVRDLAKRFGTPVFRPHLTLAGDLAAGAAQLTGELDGIVRGLAQPVQPVLAVEAGPDFFRSFYTRFEPTDTLRTLRTRAYEAGGVEEPSGFLPHVSLAYGAATANDQEQARAEWSTWLEGMDVRFDRVAVVLSASGVPIEDWAVIATKTLAREVAGGEDE